MEESSKQTPTPTEKDSNDKSVNPIKEPVKTGSVEPFDIEQKSTDKSVTLSRSNSNKLNPKQLSLRNVSYLGRFILTFYSFYAIIILVGIILQYILVVGGLLFVFQNKVAIFFYSILFIFFCFFMSNVLIIPLWEFTYFPYLTQINYEHNIINLWRNILDKPIKTDKEWVQNLPSIAAIALSVLYILMFFSFGSNGLTFDFINLFTNAVTILHLVVFYFSYVVLCFKFIYCQFTKKKFNIEMADKDQRDITLLQYVELCKKERKKELKGDLTGWKGFIRKNYWKIHFYFKFFGGCFTLFIFIIIGFTRSKEKISIISLPLWFCIFFTTCVSISFPLFLTDEEETKCVCEYAWFFFKETEDVTERDNHKKILALVFIRIAANILMILVGIGFVVVFFFISDEVPAGGYFYKYPEQYENKTDIDDYVSISSPLCYSSIHGLSFYQIIALSNDAYYWDNYNTTHTNLTTEFNENTTQFAKWYTELFFNKSKGEEIIPHGELIYDRYNHEKRHESKEEIKSYSKSHSKIVHYTVKTSNGQNVTVLAIKGTSSRGDFFVDAQLFLPSALLTLAHRLLPLVNDQNSYTAIFLEYMLTLPFRTLKDFTVIDKYIRELKEVTENLNVYNRTIVLGHSLGGGLSKVVAKLIGKNSISLSGPGISMTSNIYDPVGFNRNFYSSFIDIIPDMDIVPRVERSGGATYRINCRAGAFPCHNSERSLCTAMITCRVPGYKQYCELTGYTEKEINDLVELTDN